MSPTPDIPDLATTAPDVVVDGRGIYFVWHYSPFPSASPLPSVPKGVLIRHRAPNGTGCVAWLPWVRPPSDPEAPCWTLLSLRPLSIAEPFICSRCGQGGGIREGKWMIGLADA